MIRIKKDRCGYDGYVCVHNAVSLTDIFAHTDMTCDSAPATPGDTGDSISLLDNYNNVPELAAGFTMLEKDVPDFSSLRGVGVDQTACYRSLDVIGPDGGRGDGAFLDLFNVYKDYNYLGLVKYRAADRSDWSNVTAEVFFNSGLICYGMQDDIFTPALLEPTAPPYIPQPIGISTLPIPEPPPIIPPTIIEQYFEENIEQYFDQHVEQYFEEQHFEQYFETYIEQNITNEYITKIINDVDWQTVIDAYMVNIDTRIDNINTAINNINTTINNINTTIDTKIEAVYTYINNNISNIVTNIVNNVITTIIDDIINKSISTIVNKVISNLPTTECPPHNS